MAIIECNEINQTVNELLIAFKSCTTLKSEDMEKLVQLVSAVNICANGGVDYSTTVTETYTPVVNEIVTYPINTFHSISVVVVSGSIIYNALTLPVGSSINLEVTNLNQTPLTFEIVGGSEILVEYIIETV